jgi:hypothetical protein
MTAYYIRPKVLLTKFDLRMSKDLKEARTLLENNSNQFNRESEALNVTIKAKVEKNLKMSETVKTLRNKCFNFATQCIARLKGIFNSVEVMSKEVNVSAEDIPGALGCMEKEVDVLDEVITGHGDFCALWLLVPQMLMGTSL